MKDYSFGLNDIFILNYEIDWKINVIKVHCANGIKVFNYTKEMEHEILKQMEYQALNQVDFKKRIKDKNKIDGIAAGLDASIGLFNIGIVVAHMTGSPILNTFAGSFLGIATAINISRINKRKKLLEDYKKTMLFIENQDLINLYLKNFYGEDIELTLNDLDLYYYDDIELLIKKAILSSNIFLTQDESGEYKLIK